MYKLTTSFPYLLNRVGVRMGDLFSQRLEADNLSLNMYRTLAALWEKGDQKLTELSEFTSVEPSTLSRMVGTLKQRGLVIRQRCENNARTVRITLTPKGRSLVECYIPHALSYEEIALTGFTPHDIQKIKMILRKIHENLDIIEKKMQIDLAGSKDSET